MRLDTSSTRPSCFKRILKTGILLGLLLYLILLCQVYFKQQRFLYYPPPKGADFNVHIQRPDIQLGGWISPGDNPDAALVVFGGNAMALSHDRQSMLRRCTNRTLILFPYRGFEGQGGAPSEQALIEDGDAVVAWAKERYPVVGVFGVSLGSGVAIGVAEKAGNTIDMLALGTPFDRMDMVARDHMAWALPGLLLKDTYHSLSRIDAVKAPIFGLRAEQDEIILGARTQALKEQASRGQWIDLPGGHDTVWASDAACDWLLSATRT